MQLESEHRDNFENGIEAQNTLTRKCLIQAFAGKTSVTRNLRHPFGTCNVAKRLGDESSIAVCLFEARLEIGGHFFRSLEMLGNIITTGSGFCHVQLL